MDQNFKCTGCGFVAEHSKLPKADQIGSRLDIGDPFTDSECPECGSLCYPIGSPAHSNYVLVLMDKSYCPKCRQHVTGLLSADVGDPGPGFGICWNCRIVGHFGVGPVRQEPENTMSTELPPTAFSNAMNKFQSGFDFREWRKSVAWKIFVAGYNHGIEDGITELTACRNLGTPTHRLYGEDQETETHPT